MPPSRDVRFTGMDPVHVPVGTDPSFVLVTRLPSLGPLAANAARVGGMVASQVVGWRGGVVNAPVAESSVGADVVGGDRVDDAGAPDRDEPFGHRYRTITRVAEDGGVSALAAPGAVIVVDHLLPRLP